MNHNDTISIIAQTDLTAHRRVKLVNNSGKANVAYAGVGEDAIGTVLQDCLAGTAASIYCSKAGGLHFVTVGNATSLTPGDNIEAAANGQVVKQVAGDVIGVYIEGAGGSGSIPRAYLFARGVGGEAALTVPQSKTGLSSTAPAGSDAGTTQTLANDLQAKHNALVTALVTAGVLV